MKARFRTGLVLLVSLACSYTNASSGGSTAEVKQLLGHPPCRFMGRFEQRREFPDGFNFMRTTGRLYHDCQHGLIWSTETPIDFTQVFSGPNAYAISEDESIEKIDDVAQSRIGSFLTKLLSGEIEAIEDQFKLEVEGRRVLLTPRNLLLKQFVSAIDITKQADDAGRIDVEIHQADGQRLFVAVEGIRTINSELDVLDSCRSVFDMRSSVCTALKGQKHDLLAP